VGKTIVTLGPEASSNTPSPSVSQMSEALPPAAPVIATSVTGAPASGTAGSVTKAMVGTWSLIQPLSPGAPTRA
jgi:hypothetical protein